MASRTRTVPTRVQVRPAPTSTKTEMDDDSGVKCTGHGRRAKKLTAGPSSKNPGRVFYTCPLGRDDPNKCKFFKWEDELQAGTTPQKPRETGGQRLGQSPQKLYAKSTDAALTTPTKSTIPASRAKQAEGMDEIDWDKVDTDELEHQAILSTPGLSQQANEDSPYRARLRAAVEEGASKRKREDEDQTPKRARVDHDNPFLSTPDTPRSPAHPVLSPALASLEQVSEHILRQERLLRAGDQMKQTLRGTITSLQSKNKELEAKVKELQDQLARR